MKGKEDMTNFEKLKQLDSDTFTEKIQAIFSTPFRNVIDWKAFMKGESENPADYIESIATCKVKPSDVELTAMLGCFDVMNESKRDLYILHHTKTMPVLEINTSNMFGRKYVTVADIDNNQILKVPAEYVEIINEKT